MDIARVIEIIKSAPCPWNPLQTPQWHLDWWRNSIIEAIQSDGKKDAE